MKQLIKFINKYTIVNNKTIDTLNECFKTEIYKKNTIILNKGEHCDKLWFIKKGLVRKYQQQHEKDITIWIHSENDIFTSIESYFKHVQSEEILQACEDTITLSISKSESEKLKGNTQIELFVKLWLEETLAHLTSETCKFNLMNAEEKYEYLKTFYPQLIQRAKLGYIASIIGITQETLSRIRARK